MSLDGMPYVACKVLFYKDKGYTVRYLLGS